MTDLTLPVRLDPNSAPDDTLHVTASGLPVLIYNINGGGKHPIHGAIFRNGYWTPEKWTDRGRFLLSEPNSFDLRDRPKAKRGWWIGVYTKGEQRRSYAFLRKSDALAYDIVEGWSLSSIAYVKEGDGLDTLADPPLWVDWAKLPGWAKWAAANESGLVCQYAHEPRADSAFWQSGYEWCPLQPDAYRLAPGFDWRETLIQRPEGV